jgi:hypothetical protein
VRLEVIHAVTGARLRIDGFGPLLPDQVSGDWSLSWPR